MVLPILLRVVRTDARPGVVRLLRAVVLCTSLDVPTTATHVETLLEKLFMQLHATYSNGTDHRDAASPSRWHSLLASARLPAGTACPWPANHECDLRDGVRYVIANQSAQSPSLSAIMWSRTALREVTFCKAALRGQPSTDGHAGLHRYPIASRIVVALRALRDGAFVGRHERSFVFGRVDDDGRGGHLHFATYALYQCGYNERRWTNFLP